MVDKSARHKYHAKFIHNHGQKPSLTFTTSPKVSSALYQLYPFLLTLDCALNKIIWSCEDVCLNFIHLVLMVLCVNLLDPMPQKSSSDDLKTTATESWLGVMSGSFLALSVIYYMSSLIRELKEDEPPTVDDIVIVLEGVLDKLERIRQEILGKGFKRRVIESYPGLLRVVIILTPVHWICMRFFLSAKEYLMIFIVFFSIYHSAWFQSTLRLGWRSLFVRHVYFWVANYFNSVETTQLALNDYYKVISDCELVPFPKSLRGLKGVQLQLQLHKLLHDETPAEKDPAECVSVKIVEFQIEENQRKWPLDGWSHTLLPYERQQYSIMVGKNHFTSKSPWEFQESLSHVWYWIDDTWRHEDWLYCDTDWNDKGSVDSLVCYTRRRKWRRRAFTVI